MELFSRDNTNAAGLPRVAMNLPSRVIQRKTQCIASGLRGNTKVATEAPLWRGQSGGRGGGGKGGHGEVTLTCRALNFRMDTYSCNICVLKINVLKFNFIEKICEM